MCPVRPSYLTLHKSSGADLNLRCEASLNGGSAVGPWHGSGEPEEALQSYRRVREQQRELGDRKGDARTREAVVEAGLATGLSPAPAPDCVERVLYRLNGRCDSATTRSRSGTSLAALDSTGGSVAGTASIAAAVVSSGAGGCTGLALGSGMPS